MNINKENEINEIINVGYQHLKNNHNDVDKYIKAWSLTVLKLIHNKHSVDLTKIPEYIDEFIKYFNEKHTQYIEDIVIFATEYHRDIDFVVKFINKKLKIEI
jgi:hypothetical protein